MEPVWRFRISKVRKKVISWQTQGRYGPNIGPQYENRAIFVLPVDPAMETLFSWGRNVMEGKWMRVGLKSRWNHDTGKREWSEPDDHLGNCGNCGHLFYSTDKAAIYCCQKCYEAAYRTRHPKPKVSHKKARCGSCGHWFQPQRSTAKFCSARCRVAGNRAKSAKKKSVKKRRVRAK